MSIFDCFTEFQTCQMQWGLAEEMVKLLLELEYFIFWKLWELVSVASWLWWHVYLKHHHPMEGGRVLRCHARQENTKHNFYWLSCIWGLTLCIFIFQIVFCRTYCYEKFCKMKVWSNDVGKHFILPSSWKVIGNTKALRNIAVMTILVQWLSLKATLLLHLLHIPLHKHNCRTHLGIYEVYKG